MHPKAAGFAVSSPAPWPDWRNQLLLYWRAWIYLAVFGGSRALITPYLMQHDRELLARRTQAGPTAETQKSQQYKRHDRGGRGSEGNRQRALCRGTAPHVCRCIRASAVYAGCLVMTATVIRCATGLYRTFGSASRTAKGGAPSTPCILPRKAWTARCGCYLLTPGRNTFSSSASTSSSTSAAPITGPSGDGGVPTA